MKKEIVDRVVNASFNTRVVVKIRTRKSRIKNHMGVMCLGAILTPFKFLGNYVKEIVNNEYWDYRSSDVDKILKNRWIHPPTGKHGRYHQSDL